jgi:hypothetical protein
VAKEAGLRKAGSMTVITNFLSEQWKLCPRFLMLVALLLACVGCTAVAMEAVLNKAGS